MKQLALRLFDDRSNHISAKILFAKEEDVGFDEPSLFSGLH